MNKIIINAVLLLVLATACTDKAITVTKGEARTIYPDMIGVNGNLAHFDKPWDNDSLVSAVKELNLGNFRYPAGSLGNYWDWDIGFVDKNVPDSLMIKWVVEQGLSNSNKRYTLENFAKGQKELGFTPVFMLNMLSKGLDHSVRNLLRAKELGLPIKYIELGNELYFNLRFEMSVYPTPEDYGKTCKIWIDSLKQHFPDAKYAIIGSYIKRKPRHIDWTTRALKFCDNADAITYHKYSPAGIDGKQERRKITAGTEGTSDLLSAVRKSPNGSAAEIQKWEINLLKNDTAYANFLHTAEHAARNYTEIKAPVGKEIWATEFNMRDDTSALRGTWANALYIAKYYDEFLKSPVSITNIHNIGGDKFPQIFTDSTQLNYIKWEKVTSKPYKLSAAGISTSIFSNASIGMTKATQLNFVDSDSIIDDRGNMVSLISGWFFESDKEKRILLINYGREKITLDLNEFSNFKTVTEYKTLPENYITSGFDDVLIKEIHFEEKITLAPFSFTLIKN